MKWLVAALVVSVLVDLFYRLREQGDKSPVTVMSRVQAMIAEAWQQYWRKAPSNIDMLLTFFRLNRKQKSMKNMPSFIRYELQLNNSPAVMHRVRNCKLARCHNSVCWFI